MRLRLTMKHEQHMHVMLICSDEGKLGKVRL